MDVTISNVSFYLGYVIPIGNIQIYQYYQCFPNSLLLAIELDLNSIFIDDLVSSTLKLSLREKSHQSSSVKRKNLRRENNTRANFIKNEISSRIVDIKN